MIINDGCNDFSIAAKLFFRRLVNDDHNQFYIWF
jgi:hypothetical protein